MTFQNDLSTSFDKTVDDHNKEASALLAVIKSSGTIT